MQVFVFIWCAFWFGLGLIGLLEAEACAARVEKAQRARAKLAEAEARRNRKPNWLAFKFGRLIGRAWAH
jgi:hypothetical protein